MDSRTALLAERVAEAADAWLRDPQDAQVYARLVAATVAWRRGSVRGPAPLALLEPDPAGSADGAEGGADDGADRSAGPAPTVTLPPRVGDALGEFVAGLQRRQAAAPFGSGPDGAGR